MSEMTERIPMTTNHTKQGGRRSTIEAHRESGVPIMLTQAIIVGPTVCDELGPTPMEYKSRTLNIYMNICARPHGC